MFSKIRVEDERSSEPPSLIPILSENVIIDILALRQDSTIHHSPLFSSTFDHSLVRFIFTLEVPCWAARSTVSMLSSLKNTPLMIFGCGGISGISGCGGIRGISSGGKPTAVAAWPVSPRCYPFCITMQQPLWQ